ncbi:PepSY-associated TM helix domain-containing protein [Psychroserpens ponticola]|uniref:PepSY-associated TM helix domain-containing protein n=1 Tax=Psychroserpens ponticola TaxID=2932268 RepID=A0ABY7RV30_9FLAO|nr:PepSY-associated TM helix domain-containing protein [Psychroserpens ponticola]WCO00673.1 PepSY-associated TM helix domain-containing protein [Psychroserpens ponticola]
MKKKNKSLAKSTRWYRKSHRFVAIILLLFIVIMSVTGLLLTWKDELELKPSTTNIAANGRPLISLAEIEQNAVHFIDSLKLSKTINRIDYRPRKGIAKVRFEEHFTELQIDCYTGAIISQKTRTADIIEMIHDGSIVGYLFKSEGKPTKLFYSTCIAFGLLFLSFSGFWLWLKPKQIKNNKSKLSKL